MHASSFIYLFIFLKKQTKTKNSFIFNWRLVVFATHWHESSHEAGDLSQETRAFAETACKVLQIFNINTFLVKICLSLKFIRKNKMCTLNGVSTNFLDMGSTNLRSQVNSSWSFSINVCRWHTGRHATEGSFSSAQVFSFSFQPRTTFSIRLPVT